MRTWLIRKLGGYADPLEALDAIKVGDAEKRNAYIEYLGGFPNWEAALAHVRTLNFNERHVVLTAAVKKLFNTVNEDDILHRNKTQWLWQGRTLRPEQIQLFVAEARAFEQSFFWKVLDRELQYHANKTIYTQARDVPDLVAGKMLLYYVDTVKKLLKKILE